MRETRIVHVDGRYTQCLVVQSWEMLAEASLGRKSQFHPWRSFARFVSRSLLSFITKYILLTQCRYTSRSAQPLEAEIRSRCAPTPHSAMVTWHSAMSRVPGPTDSPKSCFRRLPKLSKPTWSVRILHLPYSPTVTSSD